MSLFVYTHHVIGKSEKIFLEKTWEQIIGKNANKMTFN